MDNPTLSYEFTEGWATWAVESRTHPLSHIELCRPYHPRLDPCCAAETIAQVPVEENMNTPQAEISRAVGLGPRQGGGVGESTVQRGQLGKHKSYRAKGRQLHVVGGVQLLTIPLGIYHLVCRRAAPGCQSCGTRSGSGPAARRSTGPPGGTPTRRCCGTF